MKKQPMKPTPPLRPTPPVTQALPGKPMPPVTQRLTPKPTPTVRPAPPVTQALPGRPLRKPPTPTQALPVRPAAQTTKQPAKLMPPVTQALTAKQKPAVKQAPKTVEALYEEESITLMNCAVEVAQKIGPGLPDKIYGNALARELELRGIPFIQQIRYSVDYKGKIVGEFIPDLIAYGKIIIETKMIDRITEVEIEHVMNYLRISGHRLALILNFKNARFETRWVAL